MSLEKHSKGAYCTGPVVLVILDGIAEAAPSQGNAVKLAYTPTLDRLERGMKRTLKAHGLAVGMPTDKDMGNSEVGHNALGAGRVFAQGARLVQEAIDEGALFEGETWKHAVEQAQDGTLHFLGLLSDGNVHSHELHLHAMIRRAAEQGVSRVRVHILLDGRDVASDSALLYVERLETLLQEQSTGERDYRIASGGGRMLITMDRYEAEWRMVERGWQIHVQGKGPGFASAKEAILASRAKGIQNDQYLEPFVIHEQGKPVGAVEDGDVFLLFNFRGDRAMEICRAFEDDEFSYFDRGRRPKVFFAGMMQYDGDLQIPKQYLVEPPSIDRTVSAYLVAEGITQYAISETQKFGHVTYFWNGNRSGKFDPQRETYVEIPSYDVPCEQRPWMKAAEITDALVQAIASGDYRFLRINYPNGDMVGHTGSLQAAKIAVEAVDLCLARVLEAVDRAGGIALVTADHGNADQMYELDASGQPKINEQGHPVLKTSHTLNPVPCYLYGSSEAISACSWADVEDAGLSHIASTLLELLGFLPPQGYQPSLLQR
ncbi:MAG: 2,3-bisphosphoglycerate-independent phosphoglycerate mutase [Myxococcota bacterium]